MGVTALGWKNLTLTATLTANSAAGNMAPGNLQTDQCSPSTGWQTADGILTQGAGALLKGVWANTQQTVRAVALVQTNLTPSASITVGLWNSPSTFIAGQTVSGPTAGYGQVVAYFTTDRVCDFVQITFNDPTNPDNHINIGGMYAGPLWIPTQGMAWDTTFDRAARTVETQSRGGQEWPVFLSAQRSRNFTLANLRGSEILDQQDLLRTAAYGGNVLLIPNVSSSLIAREAVYGRLRSSGGVGLPMQNADRFSWSASVTERL
jgi:hypothetical protein